MELHENDTFFFDLDKTIWNWDSLTIGAADLLDSLRSTGKNVYFHTDNTALSREEYAQKLNDMGIKASKDEVLTAGYVAAQILVERDIRKVYVSGESGLIKELDEEGIEVTQDADTALMGFDRQFNYSKLEKIIKVLEREGDVLTCSTEKTFRRENGEKPHQEPFNRAVRTFTETENIGKPSEEFRKIFKKYFSYYSGKSVFIGDRFADIETGNKLGMTTAAVLSGEIDEKGLKNAGEDQVPDYALTSLHKLRRRVI